MEMVVISICETQVGRQGLGSGRKKTGVAGSFGDSLSL